MAIFTAIGLAYGFTPYAIPDIAGALLSFIMLYLLVKFAPENRVNLVLALYLFFATLTSLTLALLLIARDADTAIPWRAFNDLSMVVIFPLQIHFLLLYMGRGKWFTDYPFHPAVLYTPAIFQLFFMRMRNLFEPMFLFWILALAVVLALSAQSLAREKNPYQRTQKLLVFFFVLLPFIWLLLYTVGGRFLATDFSWTAGYFFAVGAALAIYAMLRYQMLNTKIVFRSGLVILISSMIAGVAFFALLRTVSWLFDLPLEQEETAAAVGIVIVLSWFFKPLFDAGTGLLERLAPDLKWKECRPEQVFLMDYNGIRVASARRAGSKIDIDLAGGMLTAVQDFLREAFKAEKKDSVRTISMGRFKLLVEHAPPVYMAIAFTGDEAPELRRDVRAILKKILELHGDRLKAWDGNRAGLEDVQEMLQGLLAKSGPEKPAYM